MIRIINEIYCGQLRLRKMYISCHRGGEFHLSWNRTHFAENWKRLSGLKRNREIIPEWAPACFRCSTFQNYLLPRLPASHQLALDYIKVSFKSDSLSYFQSACCGAWEKLALVLSLSSATDSAFILDWGAVLCAGYLQTALVISMYPAPIMIKMSPPLACR